MEYPVNQLRSDSQYYAFQYSANESGTLSLTCLLTHWTGWEDSECRIELRVPSHVDAQQMAKRWERLQMPFHVINNVDEYARWLIYGGNAIISVEMANRFLEDSLRPSPSVQTGRAGFTSRRSLPDDLFRRVPTPKLRMAMLKRDEYRCRICGRRAERYVDIELHVHHIRPHSQRGPTHPDNLITLCHTCHKGLAPHFEWSLYDLLEDRSADAETRERQEYLARVKAYRLSIQNAFAARNDKQRPSNKAPQVSKPTKKQRKV